MLRAPKFPKLAALAGLWLAGVGGLVAAQPAPPPAQVPAAPPPAPIAAAPEEAPPQAPLIPAPVVVPPITEKEIEPAPPPPQVPAKPAVPTRRARYDIAVLHALDKVTAESMEFEAPVGKPIRYKGLIFTVRACERTTAEEATEDSIAYLTIDSQPRAEPGMPPPPSRQVFKGWMYASSPGLHPLEHPVYDAWVISCRAAAPSAPAAPAAPPTPSR